MALLLRSCLRREFVEHFPRCLSVVAQLSQLNETFEFITDGFKFRLGPCDLILEDLVLVEGRG